MGADYLYLEAIRGSSRMAVRQAIIQEMSAEGWRICADDESDSAVEHTIEVAEHGAWLVVVDRREKDLVAWAERLAHALGSVGITARSDSDFGSLSLRRFDGTRANGVISFDAAKAKRSRRCLATEFLADLAPPKNRVKLRTGIDPAGRGSDAILASILALAGLPAPLDRYIEDTGGAILRFRRPLRAEQTRQPSVRVRKVGFEASFHVRDVGLGAATAAITKALVDTGLCANPASANPARQVFVREWRGWTSFGEVAYLGKPIDWGKAMSRALASPVLEVLSGGACAEVRTYVDKRVAACIQVFSTLEQLVVDPALLAPFGVRKKLKLRLPLDPFLGTGDVGSALDAVGAALGLDKLVLAGSIKGQVLTFE